MTEPELPDEDVYAEDLPEDQARERFTLPRRPPLPAFDGLPPSYKTLRNLHARDRVIE